MSKPIIYLVPKSGKLDTVVFSTNKYSRVYYFHVLKKSLHIQIIIKSLYNVQNIQSSTNYKI